MNGNHGATLTITLTPDGQVQVHGPLGNKGLCYMMLECAKDAIRDYEVKQKAAIQVPRLVPPDDVLR